MSDKDAEKTLEKMGLKTKEMKAEYENIRVDAIRPSPFQPRNNFDQKALEELAKSISEIGVQQPIILRKVISNNENYYELIAGERRVRASKLAAKVTIPAIIQEVSDSEAAVIAFSENLQRQDLNLIEVACYAAKLKEVMGSVDAVARKAGKSERTIERYLRVNREITSTAEFLNLFKEQAPSIDLQTALSFADLAPHIRKLLKTDKREFTRIIDRLRTKGIKNHLPSLKKKFSSRKQEKSCPEKTAYQNYLKIRETRTEYIFILHWPKTRPMEAAEASKIRAEVEAFFAKISNPEHSKDVE